MGLIKMFKPFVLMLAQIFKKILILVIIIAIISALYLAWKEFIQNTQKHSKGAAVNRARKQGVIK